MKIISATALVLALGIATPALAGDKAVEAPIFKFVDSFNKGDIPGAAATMTPSVSIIDEFSPHLWTGVGAFKTWGAAYGKDAAARGITDPKVVISTPTREVIAGSHAYVIVPAVYTFKQKGVAMSETAQMTLTLTKGVKGWKITGWAWTGPDPSPVN
jgi:hypothetical protein